MRKIFPGFALALLLACLGGAEASAENRMAGRPPGLAEPRQADADADLPPEKEDGKKPQRDSNNVQVKSPIVNTPQPHTGKTMNRKAMESLGPLTNPLKGGLGDDMWAGSSRAVVQQFLPLLPVGNTLASIQRLTRRVLLSNGDSGLLRGDAADQDGRDLFTLRLEKLLEMGAYSDAVALYTLIEGEPSHDRLARAGIIALMSNGAPAQACLEVRAAHKEKAETEDSGVFWSQMDAVCTFIQAESIKTVQDSTLKVSSPVSGIPGSKVLTTLVSRPDYRYTISSPRDLSDLSEIERSVLKGLGRFDYTRLKVKKLYTIPSPVLMIMAGDPNMPVHFRLSLNLEAAERGLLDDEGLGSVYVAIAKQTEPAPTPTSEPSNTLFGRYVAAIRADAEGPERGTIVTNILENYNEESVTQLLPFARMVPAVNPARLSKSAIRTGTILMLEDGISPPGRWVKAWLGSESGNSEQTEENLMLYLANLVPENLPTESAGFEDDIFADFLDNRKNAEASDIYAVFSGLGRQDALHKYLDIDAYEKNIDLTQFDGYVIPGDGVMDKLHDAAKNDRLGETVLLASVALSDYDPAKTHPGVLREVLKSLDRVGLKEEARAVAIDVILRSKQ